MSSDPTLNPDNPQPLGDRLERRVQDMRTYLDIVTDPDMVERAENCVKAVEALLNVWVGNGDGAWVDIREDIVCNYWPDEVELMLDADTLEDPASFRRLQQCELIVDRALNHLINERLKLLVLQRTWSGIQGEASR